MLMCLYNIYKYYTYISLQGKTFFSTPQRLGPLWGPPTQPPGGFSPDIKRPGREADHSPPLNTEVKNGGTIPLLPHTSSKRGA
jgi:hypothetical protein